MVGVSDERSQVLDRLKDSGRFAIELNQVSRYIGALQAVAEVDLQIKVGERRAVLGSNGAGKTTLLNLITGDHPVSAGKINFFGEDITEFPVEERIRRGVRRTYQISLLFEQLTVWDNVYLALSGVSNKRMSLRRPKLSDALVAAAEDLIKTVNLTSVAQTFVNQLSHGQQRQLEICLALAGSPRFILFDEPAAGLSTSERSELIEILQVLPAHIGYIIIEHDMDVALRVVDTVTMMHNGRIFKEGTPDEIAVDPQVQELYLGAQSV